MFFGGEKYHFPCNLKLTKGKGKKKNSRSFKSSRSGQNWSVGMRKKSWKKGGGGVIFFLSPPAKFHINLLQCSLFRTLLLLRGRGKNAPLSPTFSVQDLLPKKGTALKAFLWVTFWRDSFLHFYLSASSKNIYLKNYSFNLLVYNVDLWVNESVFFFLIKVTFSRSKELALRVKVCIAAFFFPCRNRPRPKKKWKMKEGIAGRYT